MVVTLVPEPILDDPGNFEQTNADLWCSLFPQWGNVALTLEPGKQRKR